MSRQINDNGMPLVSGLDVFVSFPIFGNERLSYNNSFTSDTITAANIEGRTSDYATEVVGAAGLPKFKKSIWYRYSTNGAFPSVGDKIPASSNNIIKIQAVVSESASSHSGIFQELGRLIPDYEYRITINIAPTTTEGTLSIYTIYKSKVENNPLTQSHIKTATLGGNEITSIICDFKAYSTSDILFLDYSSASNGSFVNISSISVKEKCDYSAPVIVTSPLTGSSTVLARQYNSSIPLDEGQY
tara:strand:+ start:1840 stop:2571 length:732 start_codon:yes stop_codon:yes gene_type:complete